MENAKMAETAVGRSLKVKNSRLRKRGYSLVEIAAGLAVVAILVLGALTLVSVVNQSRLFTQASNELNVIQQAVRSLYNGQSSFTGVNASTLINTKSVPAKMIVGTTLRHAFSGQIDVAAASAAGGAGSGFQVTFRQIPSDVCVKMLTADLGRGLYSAGVSSQVGQDGLPFTPTTAASHCSANYNDVSWVFY